MKKIFKKYGQAMLEFTFAMIMIMLMMYSMMMIFRWVGLSLAERRIDHDTHLTKGVNLGASLDPDLVYTDGPVIQLDSYFHKPIKMNAVSDWF